MSRASRPVAVLPACGAAAVHRSRLSALAWVLLVPAPVVRAQGAFPPPREPSILGTLRARGPVAIDGRLAEPDWDEASVARGFRQIEPQQGSPASFDTEVRILYDAQHLYVGARCHDPAGRTGVRVKNLRRDFDFSTDDVFGVSFDTFRDGQNAMVFETNPHGARRDQQVRDGDVYDLQWDALWHVRTEVDSSGWTAEMAIPWSTLRYPSTRQDWAVNFVRVIRRLNETTGWSPWPRAYTPYRMSYAGLLSGLEPPPPSTNVRVQPYIVAQRNDANGAEDVEPQAGGDVKWAITPGTVLDATFNTDFAQADVDRQVVNLTRFSVLFPEQRPFFLENVRLFSAGLEREVRPFFSRRIGLDDSGRPIPIDGGLRLTHRTPTRSAGALLIRQEGTEDVSATTFAVGRYVQNVGRGSRVGGLVVTRADEGTKGVPSVINTVAALDSFLRVTPGLYVRAMLSGSSTDGAPGDGLAGSLDLSREGNWGIAWWVQEYIGPRYRAGTGFVTRPNLIRSNPGMTLDLRPSWKPRFVRRFVLSSRANIYHRASDRSFQEASWSVPLLGMSLENGGWFFSYVVPTWQRLDHPFTPLPGIRIEAGEYQYTRYSASIHTDPSRRFSLRIDGEAGPFYDGRSRTLAATLQANPSPRLNLQLAYSTSVLRDMGREKTDLTTHLFQPVLRVSLNPRVQLTSFYQYNTAAHLSTWNARFSWELRPLSYLYLVFNDRRPTPSGAVPRPAAERQIIVKLTFNAQL